MVLIIWSNAPLHSVTSTKEKPGNKQYRFDSEVLDKRSADIIIDYSELKCLPIACVARVREQIKY